jgi:hypothetical protein
MRGNREPVTAGTVRRGGLSPTQHGDIPPNRGKQAVMPSHVADAIRQLRRAAAMRALYPRGHPTHGSAVESARESVAVMLGDTKRAELVFVSGAIEYQGEPLPDDDGAIGELAACWRAHGISGLAIERGVTEAELDLLLDMSVPSNTELNVEAIRGRLREISAQHLEVTETDFAMFVPRSRLPEELRSGSAASESLEAMRELVRTSQDPGEALSETERHSLLLLLDDPQALANAVELGVLTYEADGPGARVPLPSDDEPAVRLPAHLPRADSGAGEQLAIAVQRLTQLAHEAEPTSDDRVYAKLAEALRDLDLQVVAQAYRSAPTGCNGRPDALLEVAKNLEVRELVEIVRGKPGAIASEPSAVCRRLLRRVSGGGTRVAELAPALRRALLEDGMAEDVYASTVGVMLEEGDALSGAREAAEELANTTPLAVRRAPEADRAARRAEIESELERLSGEEVWADRAVVSTALLCAAETTQAQAAAAADLKLSLQRTPPDLKPDVWVHVALELGELLDPRGPADDEQRAVAGGVLAETAQPSLVEDLLDFLPLAGVGERLSLFRALAFAESRGRGVLAGLLIDDVGDIGESDVLRIVNVLLDAEESGVGGGDELSYALVSPRCWAATQIVRILTERGGEAAEMCLLYAVQQGESRLRWDIVRAVGAEPDRHLEVLEEALLAPDNHAASAAALHLAMATDPQAAAVLLAEVRPFQPRDPRFPVRLAVVQALGRLRFAGATESLARVLDAKTLLDRRNNDILRAAAAEALVRIGTEPALRAVAAHAERERCPRVRELALGLTASAGPGDEGREYADAS